MHFFKFCIGYIFCHVVQLKLFLLFLFIVASTPLNSDPFQVFFGQSLTLTCGPPPPKLNFSTDWSAEWRRDSFLITEDTEHIFSRQNGTAKLTVSRFFRTDNGKQIVLSFGSQEIFFIPESRGSFRNHKLEI